MTKNKQHMLFVFGRNAICPLCSGLLLIAREYEQYRCIDCQSAFRIVGEGIIDKNVICEQILKKGAAD